jgi:SAM-dependent methyltransferase
MSERSEPVERSRRLEVPRRFTRGAMADEEWEMDSAAWLVEYMCERVGLADLHQTEVLDMGCGVKFTKLFLNHLVPIGHYVGVDVNQGMIEFLQANVDDPRFEFFHLNVKNGLYNPHGEAFDGDVRLPVRDRKFDLICLFSVFTHLAPDDYRTMLTILRRHVRPDGILFFSAFIDELTEGGHGLMDSMSRTLESDPRLAEIVGSTASGSTRPVQPFRDLDPTRPLRLAVYSKDFARKLIEANSWRVVSLSEPDLYIQHNFVCAPA